jgi:hypothetical protein
MKATFSGSSWTCSTWSWSYLSQTIPLEELI